MRTAMKKALSLGLTAAICSISLTSCGTTSNNDQGTSFQAFGWFDCPEDQTSCSVDELVGVNQGISLLFSDESTGYRGYWSYFGVINRLNKQFIRVMRTDCSYTVPGSSLSIPSSSLVQGISLNGSGENQFEDVNGFGNVGYLGTEIIPTEVFQFLNVNQNSLPELPYTIIVNCSAVGATQSGDVLETNDLSLEVRFVDKPEFVTPGFVNGVGTGGTYDSFTQSDGTGTAPATAPETASTGL